MTIKEIMEIEEILKDVAKKKQLELDEMIEMKSARLINQDELHKDIADLKRYIIKVNNGIRNIENFVIN